MVQAAQEVGQLLVLAIQVAQQGGGRPPSAWRGRRGGMCRQHIGTSRLQQAVRIQDGVLAASAGILRCNRCRQAGSTCQQRQVVAVAAAAAWCASVRIECNAQAQADARNIARLRL